MARDYDLIHVYDGLEAGAWVAPKGTTRHTGIEDPAAAYKEVGWLSEDGVSEEHSGDMKKYKAHQAGTVVKRKRTDGDVVFKIQALEENAVVHSLKHRGATTTVTGGVAATVMNKLNDTDQREWFIRDIADDGTSKCYAFLGTHELTGSIEHKAEDLTVHEFTLSPVGEVTEYTDNPAIVAAVQTAP